MIVEDLAKLIEIWKERRTYQGLQAREAFDAKDMKLQATLMNNRKQIGNCILDLMKILDKEKQRDKRWNASCEKLENLLKNNNIE